MKFNFSVKCLSISLPGHASKYFDVLRVSFLFPSRVILKCECKPKVFLCRVKLVRFGIKTFLEDLRDERVGARFKLDEFHRGKAYHDCYYANTDQASEFSIYLTLSSHVKARNGLWKNIKFFDCASKFETLGTHN